MVKIHNKEAGKFPVAQPQSLVDVTHYVFLIALCPQFLYFNPLKLFLEENRFLIDTLRTNFQLK